MEKSINRHTPFLFQEYRLVNLQGGIFACRKSRICILAPTYKIKEEQDKLDPVTGKMTFDENGMPQKEKVEVTIPAFRVVSVFDVSQTDGKPIPELLSMVEGYEDFVHAVINTALAPIGFEGGGDIIKAYSKKFAVDRMKAVVEFQLLGVSLTNE